MSQKDLEFDEHGGVRVPIENVLEIYVERNKRLTLEVSMLEAANELLKSKVFELQKQLKDQLNNYVEVSK